MKTVKAPCEPTGYQRIVLKSRFLESVMLRAYQVLIYRDLYVLLGLATWKDVIKMTMRKFIIEFHPDGSVTWNEYDEPKTWAAPSYTHDDWVRLLNENLRVLRDRIDMTDPGSSWDEDKRLLYKMGACAFVNLIKHVH